MRPQDNFNIITGEVKNHHPMNSTSKRFASLDLIKSQKLNGAYNYIMPASKRLGKAKDEKLFTYTYCGNDPIKGIYESSRSIKPQVFKQDIHTTQPISKPISKLFNIINASVNSNPLQSAHPSLINATKQPFNIISHSLQSQPIKSTSRNWSMTKRSFPISNFRHQGRPYAPNYVDGLEKKLGDNPNHYARKRDICADLLQVQKTYGTGKLFRKFK